MPTTKTYKIVPDPSLQHDIGATSFGMGEAIAEIVANSIDARIFDGDTPRPMHVSVTVDAKKGQVVIVDDGVGMDEERLAEAMRLGVKMDKLKGVTRSRKGMFGLGLKTAAASMGKFWSVHTRPYDKQVEHRVIFDLTKYSARAGDASFDWSIEVETRPHDLNGPLGSRSSGTAIIVERLRERDPMLGPIMQLLGNAFKPHLGDEVSITVNTEPCGGQPYDLVDGSRQDVDIVIDAAKGMRITGWVGLDKKTHNKPDYGLNLYRKAQLIELWNKSWFRAHLMSSRIMGEINLDFVPTNFNKRGFQTQSPEWEEASKAMRELLVPFVRASGDMSRGKHDKGRFVRAIEGLNRAMGHIPEELTPPPSEVAQGGEDDAESEEPARRVEQHGFEVSANSLKLPDGTVVALTSLATELDSVETAWDYIYDPDRHELQAVLNTASLLFNTVKDHEFLGTLALADSVAFYLIDHHQVPPSEARASRNRWLFLALGGGK
jgi:hypothetical protein